MSKKKKPCANCGRGFIEECLRKKGPCEIESLVFLNEATGSSTSATGSEPTEFKKKGGTYANLKDPHSTGRKRAAKLYPLDRDKDCEWRGLKNCGGGRIPIFGCIDGKQTDRHHGPVKNTTRNQLGNVHRICKRCHNHWHELNDLIYDETEYALLPHDPIPAEEQELILHQVEWVTGNIKTQYELASSKNKGKLVLDS